MNKEFSGMLCNLYIAALTLLLPLYTRGTYVMLGDAKYSLFQSVSLLCLGIWAVTVLAGWLAQTLDRLRTVGAKEWFRRIGRSVRTNKDLSLMDACLLLYGGVVVISALCSSYSAAAWTGYQDWYMGAISQLIFVGIYFFVSRAYRGSGWPIYLWEAAFFVAMILGLCSRLGFDPLGLLEGFAPEDWEYSHLISTIGNINWFCGYCSVALAMPLAGYLRGRTPTKTLLLYLVSVMGFILLCIQGSDVGPVLAAAALAVCMLWGYKNVIIFRRTILLAASIAFGLPCYAGLVRLRGEAAIKAIPADGLGLSTLRWGGWWLIGIVCVGLYFLLRRLSVNQDRATAVVKGLWMGTIILGVAALAIGGMLYLPWLFHSQAWTGGRGALWRLAWQGFLRGDLKQKLLGAGPDCFAEYIYSIFAPSEMFTVEGHWAGAVFANAHNQWLNHLVNIGLLGLFSVAGLSAASVKRYRGFLTGVLALAMYGVNSLVSFQQVLSTPLFFMMLGICEYKCRQVDQMERRRIRST